MGRSASKGRSKKAWKQVEISNPEEDAIIEKELKEGIGQLAHVKNDDLFFVDTTGNHESQSNKKKRKKASTKKTTPTNDKEVGQLEDAVEELAGLLDTEKMQDEDDVEEKEKKASKATTRKNKKRPRPTLKNKGGKEFEGTLEQKREGNKPKVIEEAYFDVWATDPEDIKIRKEAVVDGFSVDITPDLVKVIRRKEKHILASKKDLLKETLVVSHPGSSVNPEKGAHQDALRQAFDRNTAEREAAKRIYDALNPPLPDPALQTLGDEEWDDDESEILPQRKKNKLLSKTDRNRQKRAAVARAEELRLKNEKKLMKQLGRADVIQKEVAKEAKLQAKQRADIAHLKATSNDRRPRLGKHKFEEAFPEVPLSDELTGSLRQVKPSVSVVSDQFKRFQAQNLIVTTAKQKARKMQGNYKYVLRKAFKTDDLAEMDEISRENGKHQKYSRKRQGHK